ncbi:Fic family protein [Svornostia abyssi]|uniref:Fic family protein n=1 Tax=Svornostia abyssi TaxID=2898438 RepID=A0ABY5PKC6_9ACTN|nr:Fic family protein [Parviterribacteraceae bacterium J379]
MPTATLGVPRRDRQGCDYEAYVPDPIANRAFVLHGDTAADIADAERAVAQLQRSARSLADSEAVARLLLRAEAVASSRIEGLEIGGRRLLKAQLARGLGEDPGDVTATEVLNNIDAMRWAVDTVAAEPRVTVEHLLEIHRRLLAGTRLEHVGGVVRTQQNWIGGSSHNPCAAAFIPPPHEYLDDLLADLCAFCNDDALPAVAQAAIAHAQFETMHPFVDGNGRTGRALIHVVLKRRGLVTTAVPPVSLVLATLADDYVSGLTATRYRSDPSATEAVEGINRWVSLFSAATTRAVDDAQQYEDRVRALQSQWRDAVGRARSDSAVLRLIDALPGAPLVTVQSAAALIDRSIQATNEAIRRLEAAGVLQQTTVGKRNRGFEAAELVRAFNAFERQLASPDADTLTSPPTRTVPYRPQ